MRRADLEGRRGCLCVTPSSELNLLFARAALEESKLDEVWVALERERAHVTAEMVDEEGLHVLFGGPRRLQWWGQRMTSGKAPVEVWRAGAAKAPRPLTEGHGVAGALLPLAVSRGQRVLPLTDGLRFRKKDALAAVIAEERRDDAEAWLTDAGWEPPEPDTLEQAS